MASLRKNIFARGQTRSLKVSKHGVKKAICWCVAALAPRCSPQPARPSPAAAGLRLGLRGVGCALRGRFPSALPRQTRSRAGDAPRHVRSLHLSPSDALSWKSKPFAVCWLLVWTRRQSNHKGHFLHELTFSSLMV